MARDDNDLDRGPTTANILGKLQAIHGTRHIDIGENDPDVGSRCQNLDRLVSIRRLESLKSCLLDHVDRIHQQKRLVFDDQDGLSDVRALVDHSALITSGPLVAENLESGPIWSQRKTIVRVPH